MQIFIPCLMMTRVWGPDLLVGMRWVLMKQELGPISIAGNKIYLVDEPDTTINGVRSSTTGKRKCEIFSSNRLMNKALNTELE